MLKDYKLISNECDRLRHKTVYKWTVLVRDYSDTLMSDYPNLGDGALEGSLNGGSEYDQLF
jgi:hypothetical protein